MEERLQGLHRRPRPQRGRLHRGGYLGDRQRRVSERLGGRLGLELFGLELELELVGPAARRKSRLGARVPVGRGRRPRANSPRRLHDRLAPRRPLIRLHRCVPAHWSGRFRARERDGGLPELRRLEGHQSEPQGGEWESTQALQGGRRLPRGSLWLVGFILAAAPPRDPNRAAPLLLQALAHLVALDHLPVAHQRTNRPFLHHHVRLGPHDVIDARARLAQPTEQLRMARGLRLLRSVGGLLQRPRQRQDRLGRARSRRTLLDHHDPHSVPRPHAHARVHRDGAQD